MAKGPWVRVPSSSGGYRPYAHLCLQELELGHRVRRKMEAVDTLGDVAEGRKHMLEKDVAQDDQLGVSLDMWLTSYSPQKDHWDLNSGEPPVHARCTEKDCISCTCPTCNLSVG